MKKEEVYTEIEKKINNKESEWLLVSMLEIDSIKGLLENFNKRKYFKDEEYRSTTLINQDIKTRLFYRNGFMGVTINLSKCTVHRASINDVLKSAIKGPVMNTPTNKLTNKQVFFSRGFSEEHDKALKTGERVLTDYYRYDVFTNKFIQYPENLNNLKKIICKKYYYYNTTNYARKNKSSLEHYLEDIYEENIPLKVMPYTKVLLKQKGDDNPVNGFILNTTPKYFIDLYKHKKKIEGLLRSSNQPVIVYNIYNYAKGSYFKKYSNSEALACFETADSFMDMICCGINVQDEKSNNETSLHYAVEDDNLELVCYLVKKSANLNPVDDYGQTPLHYAVKMERSEIVRCLLRNNADLNIKDDYGQTPLHYAVKKGYVEIVDYLLALTNADLNLKDDDDQTPLHYAVENENLDIVTYLLRNNANLNLKNKNNQTPLDLAKKKVVYNVNKMDELYAIIDLLNSVNLSLEDPNPQTPLHLAKKELKASANNSAKLNDILKLLNNAANSKNKVQEDECENSLLKNKNKLEESITENNALNTFDLEEIVFKTTEKSKSDSVHFND